VWDAVAARLFQGTGGLPAARRGDVAAMGKRDVYAPGVFCWVDLATSDVDGAKAFYARLFGWEYDDRDVGGGNTYTLAGRDGQVAVGMMAAMDDGPPRWQSYIAVSSADDATAKAEAAGATVLMAPMDVGPAGRAALLRDPAGAAVFVWEANERPGADVVNEPGALCWNDLMTRDVAKATAFYRDAFGWDLARVEGAPDDRHSIHAGGTLNGGIAGIPEAAGPELPSYWLACFAVDDVPASHADAEAAGGRQLTGVLDLPGGRFAVVADPQGAAFGLVDGDMDP
jgi:predicted enzyme related to lactoylglutathione lyase